MAIIYTRDVVIGPWGDPQAQEKALQEIPRLRLEVSRSNRVSPPNSYNFPRCEAQCLATPVRERASNNQVAVIGRFRRGENSTMKRSLIVVLLASSLAVFGQGRSGGHPTGPPSGMPGSASGAGMGHDSGMAGDHG